jgi:predicted membrane chloride channel (bestrophin family)
MPKRSVVSNSRTAGAVNEEYIELTKMMNYGDADDNTQDPTGVWHKVVDDGNDGDAPISKQKLSYTFTELQGIEEKRREILRRVELPFWKLLSFREGTCLGILSRDSLLWASLGIYTLIRIQVRLGMVPAFVASLSESNIDVIGGFLSFFLVLFVNQSNGRFTEMYKKSMECERRIFDTASLVAVQFPPAAAARLVRFMNAAHVAGYVGLSHTYTTSNLFDALQQQHIYLTEPEMARCRQLNMNDGAECFRELCQWCMMEIQVAFENTTVDGRFAGELREKVLAFRAAMESLFDYADQPIHFFYIHFLSLLTVFYLPIFAMSNAYSAGTGDEVHWATDCLGGLIVVLQSIFVIGLRLLGQKMVDPYGDDLEDLSVLHYLRDGWTTSNRILRTQCPAPLQAGEEESLQRIKTVSLGRAWETCTSNSAAASPLNAPRKRSSVEEASTPIGSGVV